MIPVSDKDLAYLCLRAYNEQTWESDYDTEILLDTINQVQCIAFRGTEFTENFSLVDVLSDLRFVPWYDQRVGWCHKGFLRAAQAAFEKLSPLVLRPDFPVALTGHSLGGAIACIFAGFMCHAGKAPVRLVTFGSPKPAYSGLRMLLFRHMNGSQKHYINDNDPVPGTPPFGDSPMPQFLTGGERHKMSEYYAYAPAA